MFTVRILTYDRTCNHSEWWEEEYSSISEAMSRVYEINDKEYSGFYYELATLADDEGEED